MTWPLLKQYGTSLFINYTMKEHYLCTNISKYNYFVLYIDLWVLRFISYVHITDSIYLLYVKWKNFMCMIFIVHSSMNRLPWSEIKQWIELES